MQHEINSKHEGRRQLKSRNAQVAQNFATWLTKQNITPNQISILSIFFAAGSGLALYFIPFAQRPLSLVLPLIAALGIQMRLLCNLLDGLVAIEGKKGTKSGELFNDIPDRFADIFILVGAGMSITMVTWGVTLGWVAALLAVMTAYVRTLHASLKAPIDFCGPMAKQHRMFTLTLACLLSSLEFIYSETQYAMLAALIVICVGSFITLVRRVYRAYSYLENKHV